MDEESPHIEVRAIQLGDAPTLHALDYSFETDRIYMLRVEDRLTHHVDTDAPSSNAPILVFELLETPVDPPLYKEYGEFEGTLAEVEEKLRHSQGGYIALANGEVAGGILLNVEEWRSVVHIESLIVGRQFRRYGVGSLLLSCAADWARRQACWAIVLETQNVNYPAIQFYLRNGLEIWSVNQHFYPPGSLEHEVAIFMGKKLVPGA